MKKTLLALLLALAGCGGDGAADREIAFADFVADQIVATADDTDPVPLNDIELSGTDIEDEDLFAGLLD